jgi:hypothetical protein
MNDVPTWMEGQPQPSAPEDPHPPQPAVSIQAPQPAAQAPPANATAMAPERMELLNRISPVSDNPGPFKALIYGPKGVGKTVFCCRAPRCILIAAEPGQRSLLNHPELRNTPVLPVKSFNDLDEIAWAKREGDLDQWLAQRYGWTEPVITFIIDTVSEMAIKTASELLDKAWLKDQNRNRFMVSQAEYRVRNELFRRLTADYVDLGVNFILTAHESEVKDESTGSLFLRPDLSDAMAGSIGGLVDVQGRLTLEEGEGGNYVRRLQVHPTRRVDAKTRIGGLPIYVENPSIEALITAGQGADGRVLEGASA